MGGTAVAARRWSTRPNAGFHGVDPFRYTGFDGGTRPSNEATVEVLVDPAPACRPASVTAVTNTSVVLPDVDCTDR